MKNSFFTTGFIVGFLIACVALMIALIVSKVKNMQPQYDERQLFARNSAFRTAFFTLMIYCAVCAVLDILEIRWAMTFVQMFLGIFISVLVAASICIFKNAYTAINEKSTPSMIIFAIVALSNGFVFFENVVFDGRSIITDGVLNELSMQLFTSVSFAVIFAVMLIKLVKDKKEVEEA